MVQVKSNKLPLGTILGYGVASIGENLAYTVLYAFFILFLTTVAGIDPAIAGIISGVAVVWDAVTDPLIGYWSDNSKSKKGRRRPFILVGCILLGLTIALLFTNVPLEGGMKIAYYIMLNTFFWLFFTTADVPYVSLGAELTTDFNERTKLRTYAAVFFQLGVFIALVFTFSIVTTFSEIFGSESAGWSAMGVLYGVIVTITFLISWFVTRGTEEPLVVDESKKKVNPIKGYISALKLKPIKYLLVSAFFINFAVPGLAASTIAFYTQINLGLADPTPVLLGYAISVIVLTPVVGLIATKFADTLGKGKVLAYLSIVSGVGALVVKLIGASVVTTIITLAFYAIGLAAFFALIFSMTYDVATVDEYKSGEKREGVIVACISFFIKFGTAMGLAFGGIALQMVGFDATLTEFGPEIKAGLEKIFIFVPSIALIISGILTIKYPLTQQKYNALVAAIELKKEGKETSEKEFETIL